MTGFHAESDRIPDGGRVDSAGLPVRAAQSTEYRGQGGGHPSIYLDGTREPSNHEPVDNPAAEAPTVMDGQVDSPLFDGYEPPSDETDGLSAGQRLTRRQTEQISIGVHPLTLNYTMPLRMHPDADRTRTAASPQDGTPTCGTCTFRQLLGHHTRDYPKCTRPGAPVSHGPATDVRAWWPACEHHQPRDDA